MGWKNKDIHGLQQIRYIPTRSGEADMTADAKPVNLSSDGCSPAAVSHQKQDTLRMVFQKFIKNINQKAMIFLGMKSSYMSDDTGPDINMRLRRIALEASGRYVKRAASMAFGSTEKECPSNIHSPAF